MKVSAKSGVSYISSGQWQTSSSQRKIPSSLRQNSSGQQQKWVA